MLEDEIQPKIFHDEDAEQLQLIDVPVPVKNESTVKVLTTTLIVIMIAIGVIYLVTSSLTKPADIPNLNLSTNQPNQQTQSQQSQQQVAGAAVGPQSRPTTAPVAPTHSA